MSDAPNRLCLSSDALVANWRALARLGGAAACGAAVKADGYGLGARAVVERLRAAGCRDFFVSSWAEAVDLAGSGVSLSVLHGVRAGDLPLPIVPGARPVLSTAAQVARWREAGQGAMCDVMVDTGMNRLGLTVAEATGGALEGLAVDTLLSHLASADEDSEQNARQLGVFRAVRDAVPARRYSLANSAGICLGREYGFDLTRPGLALYGGVPRPEAAGHLAQVVTPEARVLQVRHVEAGETVGYGATWTAPSPTRIAVVNMGYADGYLRCHAGSGGAAAGDGRTRPLVGRVSMDLTAFDVGDADIADGDWLAIDYHLPATAQRSGLSQYELLTGLGARFDRIWR